LFAHYFWRLFTHLLESAERLTSAAPVNSHSSFDKLGALPGTIDVPL
jgi:hypothetical protein